MKFKKLFTSAVLSSAVAAIACSSSAFAGDMVADGKTSKEVKIEEKAVSPFTVNFSLGYDSEYIFRGVDILNFATDDGDLVWADFNISAYGITAGAWYAEAINKGTSRLDYNELDLYLSYTKALGPVNLTAGYIFYLFPDTDNTYTNEVNIGISTSAIPFITPSLFFYYDLSEDDKDVYDGGYLEFKLASSIPVIPEKLSIEPYALVSYDFEYNSAETDWNNIQVGVSVPFKVAPNITISAYGAYSWALSAIDTFQNDELWGGAKIGFSF